MNFLISGNFPILSEANIWEKKEHNEIPPFYTLVKLFSPIADQLLLFASENYSESSGFVFPKLVCLPFFWKRLPPEFSRNVRIVVLTETALFIERPTRDLAFS